MNTPIFLIDPTDDELSAALESWHWLPIEGKAAIATTSFGDVFLADEEGVWFLDTLEGSLDRACDTPADLRTLLNTEEAQDKYLLAGLVIAATEQGMTLEPGQCYDFEVNPILGGKVELDNVNVQNFVVAVNVAGQIHKQVKDLPPGTQISGIDVAGPDS